MPGGRRFLRRMGWPGVDCPGVSGGAPGSVRRCMMAGGMMRLGQMRFCRLGVAGRVLGVKCSGAQGAKAEDCQNRGQSQCQNAIKLHPVNFLSNMISVPFALLPGSTFCNSYRPFRGLLLVSAANQKSVVTSAISRKTIRASYAFPYPLYL
jgi:hypothetical protein